MTIPLWTPFALLAGVCAIWPRPSWTRRVDWARVAALGFCAAVWAAGVFVVVRFL